MTKGLWCKISRFFKYLGWTGGLSLLIVLLVLVLAVSGPPGNPLSQTLRDRLTAPMDKGRSGKVYALGTDPLGRDVLNRIIYGCRVSVLVGVLGVTISVFLGIPLGLMAGYWGRWLERLVSRLADIQLSIPFLLFAIALMASVGTGFIKVILVLGIARWAIFYRIARAEALSMKNEEYMVAARAIGAGDLRVVFKHLLPNVASPIIVAASFGVADTILAEAGLSYLGLGVPTTMPSWGLLVREGKDYLAIAWWVTTFPGLAIMAFILAINILGDRLRDFLNPEARRLVKKR